ncbi:MAG: hypothetical protein ACE1ZQ_09340, partial [Ignavibacteriaceae bacterium]
GGYMDHLMTEKENAIIKFLTEKTEGKVLHKRTNNPLIVTAAEAKELKKLELKKENPMPVLSVGAKTECRKWLGHRIFNDRMDVSNDQIEKGKETESEGLLLAANYLGVYLNYNDKRETNDYLSWEIDAEFDDTIIDNKSSWSSETFPCWDFEEDIDKKYWWQGQGYMGAKSKSKYILSYALVNAPDSIIEKLAWRKSMSTDSDYDDCYDEIKDKITYDNVPIELRIKMYRFDFDEYAFSFVKPVIEMCRLHIKELIDKRIEYLEKDITTK